MQESDKKNTDALIVRFGFELEKMNKKMPLRLRIRDTKKRLNRGAVTAKKLGKIKSLGLGYG